MIIDSLFFSIIEMNFDKSATELYNLLKTKYNTLILITFSILHRKFCCCSLINHKSSDEYFYFDEKLSRIFFYLVSHNWQLIIDDEILIISENREIRKFLERKKDYFIFDDK